MKEEIWNELDLYLIRIEIGFFKNFKECARSPRNGNHFSSTIAKRSTKRLKFLNPDPFTKRESAVSNFHTNLYGALKSHNITAQSAPDFGHALFNPLEPLT